MPINYYLGNSSPHCPHCGASNPFINAFCLNCGEKILRGRPQASFDPLYDDPKPKRKAKPQTASGYWNGVLGMSAPSAAKATQQLPDPAPVRPAPRKQPAHYCPHCVNCHPHAHHHFEYDEPNNMLRAVSFVAPPVGLYISTVNKKSHPLLAAKTARSAVFGMMFFCALAAGRAPLGNAVGALHPMQSKPVTWFTSVLNRVAAPNLSHVSATANPDKLSVTTTLHGRSATPNMRHRHHTPSE